MFMVLSSWQSHCESSPGSFDECRMTVLEHVWLHVENAGICDISDSVTQKNKLLPPHIYEDND